MANQPSGYETLYGIGLLDDLHNYFPAVLYDTSRFRTVQSLLHYIQTNARNRFDLYSFGQRHYLSASLDSSQEEQDSPPPLIPPRDLSAASVPVAAQRRAAPASLNIPPHPPAPASSFDPRISAHIELVQDDLGFDTQSLSLLNLLNVLGTLPSLNSVRQNRYPANFMEPVVVRPTPEQIERGSTRSFPPEDTVCAICQDSIPVNQMARRLTSCGHTFHISCIDTWYQRDVRCPTCRHDIRESNSNQDHEEEEHAEEVN